MSWGRLMRNKWQNRGRLLTADLSGIPLVPGNCWFLTLCKVYISFLHPSSPFYWSLTILSSPPFQMYLANRRTWSLQVPSQNPEKMQDLLFPLSPAKFFNSRPALCRKRLSQGTSSFDSPYTILAAVHVKLSIGKLQLGTETTARMHGKRKYTSIVVHKKTHQNQTWN